MECSDIWDRASAPSPSLRAQRSNPTSLLAYLLLDGLRRCARNDVETYLRDLAASHARGIRLFSRPLGTKGAGNAGRPMRPIAACAMSSGKAHTRCQVTPESPGIPHAMVYGLWARSPRCSGSLATVTRESFPSRT